MDVSWTECTSEYDWNKWIFDSGDRETGGFWRSRRYRQPTGTTPAQIVLMECDFERVRIWSEPAQLIVIIVNISTR